jgi:RHS repeat-associated protein
VETPSYDQAGNLLADGRWNYTWDSEDQLISIETTAAAQQAGLADTKVSFTYDYLGRRIQKVVSIGGAQTSQTRYVYFGWNVMAELDASGNVLRHFVWGPGIDGTIGGTGGVGGLVMIQDSGHTYMPAFDGNGDVTVLLDASNGGAIAAKYEYSPFGELLQKSGSYSISNPFRWSTKWTDDETSLVYYGHRYYNAATGRFISRDPIGEAGGMNLYGFCGNDGINRTDMFGYAPGDSSSDPIKLPPVTAIPGADPDPQSQFNNGFGFTFGDATSFGYFSSDGAFLPPVDEAVTVMRKVTVPGKRIPPPGDKSSLATWPSNTQSPINASFPDKLEAALEVLTQAGYTLEGGTQNGSTVSYTLLDPNGNAVGDLLQNQLTGSWAADQTAAPNSTTTSSSSTNYLTTVALNFKNIPGGDALGVHNPNLFPQHSFVTITNNQTGEVWIARAGPGGPGGNWLFGSIKATVVPDVPGSTLDYGATVNGSQVMLNTNVDPATLVGQLSQFSNAVNQAQIGYNPLTQNSNSFAFQAIQLLTGSRPQSPVWAPASQTILNVGH